MTRYDFEVIRLRVEVEGESGDIPGGGDIARCVGGACGKEISVGRKQEE